jgi:Carboxypeptidase regulatory-like domain
MTGDHRARRFFVAGVAALFFLAPAAAWEGVVTGHVEDAQGQPLQGVTVKLLKAGAESPQQTTGTDGNFRFNNLGSGVYSASAALEGYAQANCPGVRIVASLERHFTIKLMPASEGGPASTCQVGEPPAAAPPQ